MHGVAYLYAITVSAIPVSEKFLESFHLLERMSGQMIEGEYPECVHLLLSLFVSLLHRLEGVHDLSVQPVCKVNMILGSFGEGTNQLRVGAAKRAANN
jgi:hypothetical protein